MMNTIFPSLVTEEPVVQHQPLLQQHQPVQQQQYQAEPFYEMTELPTEEPVETVLSSSKRSYKDVLQQRSDSPNGPEPTIITATPTASSSDENLVLPKPTGKK